MVELEEVRLQLAELGLTQLALQLEALLERAQKEKQTYLSFLGSSLERELAFRQERKIEVKFRMAHLPYRKTLAEFDFSFQPSIDERLIRELAGLAFLERKENLLFLGPPGVGKSHLAVALGVEALLQGIGVYFTTLSHLLEDLKRAYKENRLDKR
ncbi:MAG TPA: ATP-binding protein, partial [Candidatus Atribacteria bacterium]|nr:ATP-binding protein [Candidatus Atribacteria bacterium]